MHEEYFKADMVLSRACLHLAQQHEPTADRALWRGYIQARMLLMGLLGELKGDAMRPKKRMLVVGADVDSLGRLVFLLGTAGFAVVRAESVTEAEDMLGAGGYDLLLCAGPSLAAEYLGVARAADGAMPAALFGGSVGQAVELGVEGIAQAAGAAFLLERVKVLAARKKGPKPQGKPPASVVRLREFSRRVG
jgi:hypothetical protein